ncbi:NAD-dependent epimerase/dehydratase family protein [Legionella busanensis]|nr:sugar nucleotide-binding protein [Legionella busanensis]
MGNDIMQTVLITGAHGYLGHHLVTKFKQNNVQVIEVLRTPDGNKLGCDLTDKSSVLRTFSKLKPDIIIHCAAFVPKSLSEYNNTRLSLLNSEMLKNILNASNCPIIYISSMTVYGPSTNILRKESDAGKPQSEYGKSKYLGECILKESKRDSIAIRIPGLFGGNRTDGLIANLLKSLMQGKPPNLPQSPLLWAGIDIEDAADGIFQLSKINFCGYNAINLGYNDIYSINKLLSILSEFFSIKLDYNIQHPSFAFDLSYLYSLSIYPHSNLRTSLLKLKTNYGFI